MTRRIALTSAATAVLLTSATAGASGATPAADRHQGTWWSWAVLSSTCKSAPKNGVRLSIRLQMVARNTGRPDSTATRVAVRARVQAPPRRTAHSGPLQSLHLPAHGSFKPNRTYVSHFTLTSDRLRRLPGWTVHVDMTWLRAAPAPPLRRSYSVGVGCR
jgi:hypothetical protein